VLSSKKKSSQEELNNDSKLLFISFLHLFLSNVCETNLYGTLKFSFFHFSLKFFLLEVIKENLREKERKKSKK